MPSRLRIGVNALYLIPGGVGGTEIYLRNLLEALARIDRRNQYFVYVNRETGADLCPRVANFAPVETGVRAKFRPGRLLWEQTGLAWATFRQNLDLLFSPGFTSPRWTRGESVTVIHDLQHRRHPENFGFFELRAWEASIRQSVKRSKLLVAVSKNTAHDLQEVYEVQPERVRVIPHGVEQDFFGLKENEEYDAAPLAELGVRERGYILAVSTVHPHKNWERLLGAYQLLRQEGTELDLVVCGLPGKAWQNVQDQIAALGLTDNVKLLGWQPRKTLLTLFKFGEALVFPSTFEGFGMPVIEAQACRLPVACSDIPALREIADGAAELFDPTKEDEIAAAVARVLRDPSLRGRNVQAGLRRAKQYTWRRAAELTLAAFLDAKHG